MDFPILNPDEAPAIALIRRAAPAIFYHARRFAREFGVEEMDLVQEAFLCLVRLITKQSRRAAYPEAAYPARRLRFAMLIYAMETCRNVRVPAYIFNEVHLSELSMSTPIGEDDSTLEDLLADELAADNPIDEQIDHGARLNSLAAALDAWLTDAYLNCWTPPPTMPQGDRYIAEVRVDFNPDGTLAATPELLNPPTDPAWRAHAESAGRGGLKCNPLRVPPQYAPYFEQWRTKTVHFDPQSALG